MGEASRGRRDGAVGLLGVMERRSAGDSHEVGDGGQRTSRDGGGGSVRKIARTRERDEGFRYRNPYERVS